MHGDDLHVLVVDDSAMVRQVMQGILSTNSRVKVSVAADPLIAWVEDAKGTSRRGDYRPGNAANGWTDFHPENHAGNANAGRGLLRTGCSWNRTRTASARGRSG